MPGLCHWLFESHWLRKFTTLVLSFLPVKKKTVVQICLLIKWIKKMKWYTLGTNKRRDALQWVFYLALYKRKEEHCFSLCYYLIFKDSLLSYFILIDSFWTVFHIFIPLPWHSPLYYYLKLDEPFLQKCLKWKAGFLFINFQHKLSICTQPTVVAPQSGCCFSYVDDSYSSFLDHPKQSCWMCLHCINFFLPSSDLSHLIGQILIQQIFIGKLLCVLSSEDKHKDKWDMFLFS